MVYSRGLADKFSGNVACVHFVERGRLATGSVAALTLASLKVVDTHSAADDFTVAGNADSLGYALFHINLE